MIKRSTQLLASVLLLGQAGIANAALSCNVAVGTLAFGAYSGAQVNSSATMTITCTRVVFDPFSQLSRAYSTPAFGEMEQVGQLQQTGSSLSPCLIFRRSERR